MAWEELQESFRKDAFERALCVAMKAEGLTIVKAPAGARKRQ